MYILDEQLPLSFVVGKEGVSPRTILSHFILDLLHAQGTCNERKAKKKCGEKVVWCMIPS
jgi:hypothetical protein